MVRNIGTKTKRNLKEFFFGRSDFYITKNLMKELGYSNDQDFYKHLDKRQKAIARLPTPTEHPTEIAKEQKVIENAKKKLLVKKKVERVKTKHYEQVARNISEVAKQVTRLEAVKKIQKAVRNNIQKKLRPDFKFDVANHGNKKRYKIVNGNTVKYKYIPNDVHDFVLSNWSRIKKMIRESTDTGIKCCIGCNLLLVKRKEFEKDLEDHEGGDVLYERYIETGEVNELVIDILNRNKVTFYAEGTWESIFTATNISNFVKSQAEQITDKVERIILGSTGVIIWKIESLYINVAKGNNAISASSYIDLPEWIKKRNACINVQNKDDKCSMWSIKCFKYNKQIGHPKRVKQLAKFVDDTDYSMLEFPTKVTGWDKYEVANDESVNIYGVEREKLFPLRTTKYTSKTGKKHINLLLIGDKSDGGNNHYVPITNMSALLSRNRDSGHKIVHCPHCLQCWRAKTAMHKYNEHMKMGCQNHDSCRTIFPDKSREEDRLSYKNTRNQVWCPYVAYLDFEAFTTKVEGKEPSMDSSFTHIYQNHKSSGYTYKIIDAKGNVYKRSNQTGGDVVNHMVKSLLNDCQDIIEELKSHDTSMFITDKEQAEFDQSTECYLCHKKFVDEIDGDDEKKENKKKVRDHDHETGEYRGACHNKCNINYNLKNFKLPVFVHNLKGYDSHLILKELSNPSKYNIGCIAMNSEKYMQFNIGKVVFKDSFNFMSSGLEKLSSNLEFDDFKITRADFPDDEDAKLMTKKGVYPYDYMDGPDKFADVNLPPIDAFYSILNDENIKVEDYERAQKVFERFGCKNMKDYHDLYLLTDVDILADVFQKFRHTSYATYGIDPTWYVSLPSYAWDCAMKVTDIELELLTDANKYLFFERGIRGGVSMVTHRHAKANNKYMGEQYDPMEENSYIGYLDANNLYGWAMSQPLPTGAFKWENAPWSHTLARSTVDWIKNIPADSEIGYVFEVDMDYPEHLHDLHNDYPLAVENLRVNNEELSDYQRELLTYVPSTCGGVDKLIGTLKSKKNYVVHYRNLQLYLDLGLKLTAVHRCLSFEQSAWLKPYIDLNTKLRTESNNDFDKDFYKLMNNAVFGKTMENVRNRIDYKLMYDDDNKERKYISKFNFAGITHFNDHMTGILMRKVHVKLNKPIYCGFAILELSKLHMLDFHYNHVMKTYGHDNVKLLFTDTDSLCYHIKTDDFYKDMRDSKELFDLSDYPKDSEFYDATNKKVIGKFKDETSFDPIVEFVGLKAKMYSFVTRDSVEKKVAKGIKKSVIKKGLYFDGYKNTLFGEGGYFSRNTMNLIRSKKHQISSIKFNKIGLCAFDDKRYIEEDGISTLAYGHKNIVKE